MPETNETCGCCGETIEGDFFYCDTCSYPICEDCVGKQDGAIITCVECLGETQETVQQSFVNNFNKDAEDMIKYLQEKHRED